jgi:nucleoside permease NupC
MSIVDRNTETARRESGLGSRCGQTTTEYLMIAGIMTAIGILILAWMFVPWRETVEDVADCVRTDDCDAVGAK